MIQFCAAKSLSRLCLSWVQTEKTPALSNMLSALPSLATNEWTSWMVSKVPIADIEPKGCLVDISRSPCRPRSKLDRMALNRAFSDRMLMSVRLAVRRIHGM